MTSLAAFLFDAKGTKRKAIKREMPKGAFRALRSASKVKTSKPVSRPSPRKLLKKFEQNFYLTDESRFVKNFLTRLVL